MHLDINNDNQNQINTALTVSIQTAIALWQAKDWQTYKATREALLTVIRSGQSDKVGKEQMQFIYFIDTHLRSRFVSPMAARSMFAHDLPLKNLMTDRAWNTATEGIFWDEEL
jgi:hypothetical protein